MLINRLIQWVAQSLCFQHENSEFPDQDWWFNVKDNKVTWLSHTLV